MERPRIKPITLPPSSFIKGEIIGAFAGDGSYYHDTFGRSSKYLIRYFLSYRDDWEYKEHLVSLLKNMGLNVNVFIRFYKGKASALEIRAISLNFSKFIKEYLIWEGVKSHSVQLNKGMKLDKDFLLGFARGLMDTDGFTERFGVACGSTSEKLIKDLEKILLKIGIIPKITIKNRKGNRKNLYLLRISRKYLEKYEKNIGFSNPRKKQKLLKILNGAARI